jgi:DNA-binding transcriptional ArsR family regulator
MRPHLDVAASARRFAALGDPTRLQVFLQLAREPRSVADIAGAVHVSRPAVSQHLRVLTDAGLVEHEPAGTRHVYRPRADGVASLRDFLDGMWDVGLARFKAAAEAAARRLARQESSA